ncbi:MAG: hypothetical protein ACXWFH_05685 [Solirubrobacterales bacterium]
MRPPRRDIAAPPFPADAEWVGGPAPRLDRLVARGPLLVHFFDLAQLNSVRALPYVRAWSERYSPAGLGVVGVHSARFPFTRAASAVAGALPRLGIAWPVAVDSRHAIWRDYGCKGWPSLFLWGRGGALRWYHLGEGDYRETELVIREELSEEGNGGWPEPLEPLRPSDAPGAHVIPPSPELLPGGSLEVPWTPGGEPIAAAYEAGGAFAAADGTGELLPALDGRELEAVEVSGPGLYELASHPVSERHCLELAASGSVSVYSLQFAPGVPG